MRIKKTRHVPRRKSPCGDKHSITEPDETEDYGLIILKSVTENGEELLSTLDSDEELTRAYEAFMEEMMEDEDNS